METSSISICLATILDHRYKLGSLQLLLEEINNNMQTININNMFTVKGYLEELFTKYSTKMDRTEKQLIPMSSHKLEAGKRHRIFLLPIEAADISVKNINELIYFYCEA